MEEDIKILEESLKVRMFFTDRYFDALENLIKGFKEKEEELEKYKKIAEKLAEVVDFDRMDFNCSPLCIHDNCIKECALEWARKEVENE